MERAVTEAKKLRSVITPKVLVKLPPEVIRLVELVPTLITIIQELQIELRLKDKELAKAYGFDKEETTGVCSKVE